ncbi:MAG: M56 family metallopeptidase [Gemmatimonadota bacterium]|nr:M56 family metallopeptidase [Gemmatimonadota bacterium]
MIVAWMVGTILLGGLIAVAATVADRAAAAAGWSRRTAWAFALAAAMLWPLGAAGVAAWRTAPHTPVAPVALSATQVIAARIAAPQAWRVQPAAVLTAIWAAASVLLLARLGIGVARLRHLLRTAEPADVDGVRVFITDTMGPAVCGVLRPRILVPRWFLDLDAPLRSVALRHEAEHAARGDGSVVLAATLATSLMPWSPAVWWLARRLRLAIELDCDARVLRTLGRGDATHRYSHLLLLVAQRQSVARLLPVLAESNVHLERRITTMHAPMRTTSRVRAAALGGVAAAVALFACSPRVTGDLTAPQTMSADRLAGLGPAAQSQKTFFEFQVQKPVQLADGSPSPSYPDILKMAGVEGEVLVQFVVEPDGTMMPGSVKILKSTHPLFTAAVNKALMEARYTPAEVDGKKVRQLVQRPFVFSISTADRAQFGDTTATKPAAVLKLAPTIVKPPR